MTDRAAPLRLTVRPPDGSVSTLLLNRGGTVVVGRADDCDVPVPRDAHLSRRHLKLSATDAGAVRAEVLSRGNPLFHDGAEVRGETVLRPPFRLSAGGTDVDVRVSAGGTTDVVALESVTLDAAALRGVELTEPDRRLAALGRLPRVIRESASDAERGEALVDLVLAGVPAADAVAVVGDPTAPGIDHDPAAGPPVRHWRRRQETDGPPRLPAGPAIAARGENRSVLQRLEVHGEPRWAFCVPVAGDVSWTGLLVTGPDVTRRRADRRADVKFVELIAETVAALGKSLRLERQAAGLRRFLAPPVLRALGPDLDPARLDPTECEASVLFCDLRGFSRSSEEAAGDLLPLLGRVSAALSVMAEEIHAHGGATGDLLGDAALAFWGWPLPDDDAPLKACRAALAILRRFRDARDAGTGPLADFRVGIGVAHGRVVAGRIGTAEQVKITAFGPTVNLASRLEGMTGTLRVPIAVDERVAAAVRDRLPPAEGRVRPLATVRPAGMEAVVTVHELLPAAGDAGGLTDGDLAAYGRAVAAFTRGDWPEAHRLLHTLPATDQAADFLTARIAEHHREAPAGWDGIVRLTSK